MTRERPHTEQPHPTALTYAKVAVVLAAVTAVEVWIFYVEQLRGVIIPIFALLSAGKFTLVVMFYMHLKFDNRMFTGLFVGGLLLATAVVLALMGLFGVVGQGDSTIIVTSPHRAAEAPAITSETTQPIEPKSNVDAGVLEIGSLGEELKFNNDKLNIKAGAEVVLRFKNNSATQQHNWVLVLNGTQDAVAADGAAAGPDNDWIQPEDARVIAHTKLLAPKETGKVQFAAPTAGTYKFVCTFPGHNQTMHGIFEVQP